MATRKKSVKLTFEEGLAQLEGIVTQMEQGQMTLDESISAYENAMVLYNNLTRMLKEGEARMEMIQTSKDTHEGVQTTSFEVEP